MARLSEEFLPRAIELLMEEKRVSTGAELSRRSGLHQPTISKMLRGRALTLQNLGAVLKGLEADVYDLARALDRAEGIEPPAAVAEPPTPYAPDDRDPMTVASDALMKAAEALRRMPRRD